jgi:hypothetical protein
MSRAIMLSALAGLSLSAAAATWDEVRGSVLPIEIMMGSLYEDLSTVSDLLGPMPDRPSVQYTVGPDSTSYSFAPGTTIGGAPFTLSASLTRVDETTWTGSSLFTGFAVEVANTTTFTIDEAGRGEADARVGVHRVRRTGDQNREYLSEWTLEWSGPTGGFAVSTHTNGARDRVRLVNIGGEVWWEWDFRKPGVAGAAGQTSSLLPASGVAGTFVPNGGTLALIGVGAATLTRRR